MTTATITVRFDHDSHRWFVSEDVPGPAGLVTFEPVPGMMVSVDRADLGRILECSVIADRAATISQEARNVVAALFGSAVATLLTQALPSERVPWREAPLDGDTARARRAAGRLALLSWVRTEPVGAPSLWAAEAAELARKIGGLEPFALGEAVAGARALRALPESLVDRLSVALRARLSATAVVARSVVGPDTDLDRIAAPFARSASLRWVSQLSTEELDWLARPLVESLESPPVLGASLSHVLPWVDQWGALRSGSQPHADQGDWGRVPSTGYGEEQHGRDRQADAGHRPVVERPLNLALSGAASDHVDASTARLRWDLTTNECRLLSPLLEPAGGELPDLWGRAYTFEDGVIVAMARARVQERDLVATLVIPSDIEPRQVCVELTDRPRNAPPSPRDVHLEHAVDVGNRAADQERRGRWGEAVELWLYCGNMWEEQLADHGRAAIAYACAARASRSQADAEQDPGRAAVRRQAAARLDDTARRKCPEWAELLVADPGLAPQPFLAEILRPDQDEGRK